VTYKAGDVLKGLYNTRTRDENGLWWSERGHTSITDEDVDVLVSWGKIVAPPPPPKPAGKISKSDPPPEPDRLLYYWRVISE